MRLKEMLLFCCLINSFEVETYILLSRDINRKSPNVESQDLSDSPSNSLKFYQTTANIEKFPNSSLQDVTLDEDLEAKYDLDKHENLDQILNLGSVANTGIHIHEKQTKHYGTDAEGFFFKGHALTQLENVKVNKHEERKRNISRRRRDKAVLAELNEPKTKAAVAEQGELKFTNPTLLNGIDNAIKPTSGVLEHEKGNFHSSALDMSHFSPEVVHEVSERKVFPSALANGIMSHFNTQFSSFVFNPMASPQEKFQKCMTPTNETGNCRYVQHCLIPSILSSFNQFMNYVCIIDGRFIGVCCPKEPVTTIVVNWQSTSNNNSSVTRPTNAAGTSECGISTNTRIVGGANADPNAWPWMVALLWKRNKRFFCGGSLINNQYVLTAAHCTFGVPNNHIVARMGEYDFKDTTSSHEDYAVVKIKRHGQYSQATLRNDIALLKLERPVEFTKFVGPICLPEKQSSYVGKNATLSGWGNLEGGGSASSVLQVATFPVVTNEECSKTHNVPIPHSLICTAAVSGDTGACNGDSGGPLMLLDDEDRWKVVALVSWGRRGCSPKFPTVYTRVSHFLEWIKKHSK